MELQIQDLVETIKKDGVLEAEKQSAAIISNAEKEAVGLIEAAKKEARSIVEEAERSADVLLNSAKASVCQSARDVRITLKKELEEQIERVLGVKVKSVADAELVGSLIKAAIGDEPKDKTAEVSADLAASLAAQLADEIRKGLVIRPVKDIDVGFRLKDGSGFYDLSDEELIALMKPFLSDSVNSILEKK